MNILMTLKKRRPLSTFFLFFEAIDGTSIIMNTEVCLLKSVFEKLNHIGCSDCILFLHFLNSRIFLCIPDKQHFNNSKYTF